MMKRTTRRDFLRNTGIASSALTFSPFFLERLTAIAAASVPLTRVYKVMNGADCFQNIAKLWQLLGGPAQYIGPTDVVVIKGNAQWPNQGYTHTGCIKAVIDAILAIPGFSGEILICDNVQQNVSGGSGADPGQSGFDATPQYRTNNYASDNWNSLALSYQAQGKKVATKPWICSSYWPGTPGLPSLSQWNPANGEGWTRYYFSYNARQTILSCPVFQSPLTPGRMIDMKNGVWEGGSYTGRKVKTIFMPTLNNHGEGSEDYAGVTSAIKSHFGATEIPTYGIPWNGFYSIHGSSFDQNCTTCAGELVGRFINTLYSPNLYITAAMWSGSYSRTGNATKTNTVLACTNPVTLDYVSCRDVISPYASWLNPDQNNNTRKQIMGCNSQGIGTIDPSMFEIVTFDFNHPTTTRLDINQKVRDFKAGTATQQDVKDVVSQYMQGQ
jgi:hypothetical protein